MSSIADGYDKHKLYEYHANTDTYQLTSPWVSSETVEMDNGTTAEARMAALDTGIDGLLDDTQTTTTSGWSSTKINNTVNAAPQINDKLTSATNVWSSDKTARYRQHFQIIEGGKTVNLPMFEGWFAIARAASATTGIVGLVDRWGGITYVQNNCWRKITRNNDENNYYWGGLAEIVVNGDVVSITNHTNMYIIVYFFTTYYFNSPD